jgi:hypothetical protein
MSRAFTHWQRVGVAAAAAFLGAGAPSWAQSIQYEGAVRYSQGTYTLDETVTSAFLLNEFTYSSQRWFAELLFPVIYQDSADVRYVGGMPMPVGDHHGGDGHQGGHGGGSGGMPGGPGVQPQDFNDLGIGDPYLKVGALLYRGVFDRNSFGVFGTIKAPVADETQGFGTGEWDFGLGVSWSRRTAKNLLFLELAYWSLGEPPDLTFKNPIAGEFTYGRVLSNPRYLLEATIWGRTETAPGVDGPLAVDVTLGRSLNGPHFVYLTLEAGLTESAPDFALIVGYRARIWGEKQAAD